MVHQFQWENIKTGEKWLKMQFEVNDSLSAFQRRSKFKQALREMRKKFPLPKNSEITLLWCNEESKYFQGVLAEDL